MGNFIKCILDKEQAISHRIQRALQGRETTVGSICSGFGVAEMVIDSLNEYLADTFEEKASLLEGAQMGKGL